MANLTDVLNGTQEDLVRQLGDQVGYGFVMHMCEKIWEEKSPGAAKSVGCCTLFLVPCPGCKLAADRGDRHCDWCCGSHRVTEKVAKLIRVFSELESTMGEAT